ncbi:MAG: amidohydrolase/deacetylase family metallohydrolase [Sphaerobacteraceae bacterium]|nr:MAG: amidohydrolase/deacetylase family metallohydrolase [Sphaerobacteraceae bacterium]
MRNCVAHTYDVVITGGEVVDPGSGVNGKFDVGIKDGKVAAVEPSIDSSEAAETIDASGQIVTPGLIDLHTHIYWGVTYWGIEPDPVAARSGVTTWLDVGSSGAYSFPGFREYIAKPARSRVYALLNLSSIGLIAPTWEFNNPNYADVDLAQKIIEANRDLILGVKARIDANTTRGVGIVPLAKARELADRVGLPLMTHIGSGPPTLDEVIPHLRPGDILTHCFTGGDHRILGQDRVVNADIKKLHDAGLVLDIGHGTGSFNYDVAEGLMEQGIMPDVISTDIHQMAIQGPMFDMPTTLSKFLNLGMSLSDVIERATIKPAQAIRLEGTGTLAIGNQADIALFRLEDGDYTFYDAQMNPREGGKRLISTKTLIDGEVLPELPERELHLWAGLPEHQAGKFGRPNNWRPGRPE